MRSRVKICRFAIRTQAPHSVTDHVWAVVATALAPTATAAILIWLFPAGCDIRGSATVYRWTCLLPGLLITVTPAVALLLPIAYTLNNRLTRPFPDGWLVIALAVGILTQVVLSGAYLFALDAAYRELFLAEVIFIPQPFVAGAIAGAVYWAALHWSARGR